MSKKLGRNEPCWCGSGKKYKKCHLNRHLQEVTPHWEVERSLKQKFSAKYCSCPDIMKAQCAGNIIKAHSVSKSSSLKRIARDGHVYGLKPSFKNLSENRGALEPELIGINRASTFTGFCAVHDNSLFLEIEDKPFCGTPEQCFLLGHRTIAREIFTKKAQHGLQDLMPELDKGRPDFMQQAIQKFSVSHSMGVDAGFRDIQVHKEAYDKVLLERKFEEARAYVIEFNAILPFACSGAFLPEEDLLGKKLQDLMDLENVLDIICFSVFSSNEQSYAVFSWISNCDTSCFPFISPFREASDQALFSLLVQFACAQFENIFFSPTWWEPLEPAKKNALRTLIAAGKNPFVNSKLSKIIDPTTGFGSFSVMDRYQVNYSNKNVNSDPGKAGAG